MIAGRISKLCLKYIFSLMFDDYNVYCQQLHLLNASNYCMVNDLIFGDYIHSGCFLSSNTSVYGCSAKTLLSTSLGGTKNPLAKRVKAKGLEELAVLV